ncbi:3-ketoacyl-ACP reductase FabG2, partial [Francisellaceae bacterium]|nr:3-ketoacyl-ACP reductase FabG2 [Francisellaceae bacterium]
AGAEKTVAEIKAVGGKADLIQFDITDRQQCHQAITKKIEVDGAFYGVVNNAGICKDVVFPAMEAEDWDSVVHTNLDSFYNVIKPCVMPMIQARKGGRIVTLASVSGIAGNRGQVNYSAAKAGVIGATKALALELAKRKITVNCVAPGLIDTDMVSEAPIKEILKMIPARRVGKTEEVAGLINYLMSDVAGYITRQVISINGGLI